VRDVPYETLQDFLHQLESIGELKRISQPVSPTLEMTEIADRTVREGGPALLFERPAGYSMPVAMNVFGSPRRMAQALGAESLEAVAQEIEEVLSLEPPTSLMEKLRAIPRLARLASYASHTVSNAVCQEVVEEEPDITRLPHLTCWPQDGGPFITLPLVITRHPASGGRNVGMYRMQVFDARTTGMHWHPQKGGAAHYREHVRLGKRMEAAVALGGDPAIIYAATAPLPENFDEILFAGFLRKRGVPMVRCRTVDIEVPAGAEIVLEGYLDPGELREEGPFGDHTGYYSLKGQYPVFHVTCLTRREHPIYPATIVGPPPKEDCFLAKATERLFLPLLRRELPELVDLNLPVEGIFHNLALVSIRKQYPGHAHKVMHALWGLGQMAFTKIIVVFDEHVNVQDMREVIWRLGNHIDPERDITFVMGPLDILDHAARQPGFGSKMGIDATRKWPGEGFTREWPDEVKMTPEIQQRIDSLWKDLGL